MDTVPPNAYRWGHPLGARLEIPENIFEAEKLLNKNRYPPLLPTYEKGYEPERDTRPYNVIGRLVEITPLMPEPNPQNTLFTQPLPFGKT
jgi:hypothetical protein